MRSVYEQWEMQLQERIQEEELDYSQNNEARNDYENETHRTYIKNLKKELSGIQHKLTPESQNNRAYMVIQFKDIASVENEIKEAFGKIALILEEIDGFMGYEFEAGMRSKTGKPEKYSLFNINKTGRMAMSSTAKGGKVRHESEFKSAVHDCEKYFKAFLMPEIRIITAKGKLVPVDKRGATHFIDYCIARGAGYGKDMLRKVYRELKK